mgnify:CR=1 FL=1
MTDNWHLHADSSSELVSSWPLRHGTMRAGLYAPKGSDDQTPHDQDEIYVIQAGQGIFVRDGERSAFVPGDLIFVDARTPHHFEDFSDDFACWVVFWGPMGGEGKA